MACFCAQVWPKSLPHGLEVFVLYGLIHVGGVLSHLSQQSQLVMVIEEHSAYNLVEMVLAVRLIPV
jgi:hypothetical protein